MRHDSSQPLKPRLLVCRVAASTTANEQSVQDPESLPFELHMLEAALELAFGWLAAEAAVLERSAQPLITGLASKVTHEGLRALHHLKLSLSGLTARVAKLQQALEGLRHDRRALAALCMLGAPVSRNRTSVQRTSGARPGHGPTGSPTPAKPVQQAQACGGGTSSPTLAQSLGSSPGGRQGQLGSPPGSPQRQASQQLDVKLVDACRALLECYSLQVRTELTPWLMLAVWEPRRLQLQARACRDPVPLTLRLVSVEACWQPIPCSSKPFLVCLGCC